jgi:hypothetical protein
MLALAVILWAFGSPAETAAARPPEESAPGLGESLSEDPFVRFVEQIDRFFGDENYAATTNESFLRLAPGLRIREGADYGFKLRVRANLELPRTQRRLGLIFSGREEADDPLDAADQDDGGVAAGLRAVLFDDPATKLRLSVGSRFRPEPDPFVRLRLQRLRSFGAVAIRPSVTGFWELDDGLGQRSQLDLDISTGPRSLVRLRGDATYGQSTAGVEFRAGLSYFLTLRERAAWKLEVRMNSRTRPTSRIVEYRARLRYRWSMLRPWLFFELEPGVRFRRAENFDPAPEVLFRIELVFGALEGLGRFDAGPRAILPQSTTSTPSSSRVSGRLLSHQP